MPRSSSQSRRFWLLTVHGGWWRPRNEVISCSLGTKAIFWLLFLDLHNIRQITMTFTRCRYVVIVCSAIWLHGLQYCCSRYKTQYKLATRLVSFPGLPTIQFLIAYRYTVTVCKTVGGQGNCGNEATWTTTKLRNAWLKRFSLQTKTGSVTSYVLGKTERRQA